MRLYIVNLSDGGLCKIHEHKPPFLRNKKGRPNLKPEIKQTVDEIFSKLAENESIKKMYSLWCEMEQQKHDVYSSAKVKFLKLTDNKAFKSVKNIIIQTVLDMNKTIDDLSIEEPKLIERSEKDVDRSIKISPLLNGSEQTAEEHETTVDTSSENYALFVNTIFKLFVNLSRCIEEDYMQKYEQSRKLVDSKLRQMVMCKKQSLGMKGDFTQNTY